MSPASPLIQRLMSVSTPPTLPLQHSLLMRLDPHVGSGRKLRSGEVDSYCCCCCHPGKQLAAPTELCCIRTPHPWPASCVSIPCYMPKHSGRSSKRWRADSTPELEIGVGLDVEGVSWAWRRRCRTRRRRGRSKGEVDVSIGSNSSGPEGKVSEWKVGE